MIAIVSWFLIASAGALIGWFLRGLFQSGALEDAYRAGQASERAARKWLDRTQRPDFLVRHDARR